MKIREFRLAVIYALVLGTQVGWHWLLSLDNSLSQSMQNVYLYRSPQGGRAVAGFLDLMLPGIVLGIFTGYIGWQWGFKKLALFVFIAGSAIVALTPLYVLLLKGREVWWWPPRGQLLAAFVFQLLKAWVLVGGVAYFAWYLRRAAKAQSAAPS